MASRQIKVIISVQDGATKKMREVEKSFKKTKDAVEGLDKKLLTFNKTLFSTTALAGTLAGAFMGIGKAITKGADFSRAETSFQRIFGPNADVLKMIGRFTDVAVDEMSAMNAAIRLSKNDIGLGSQQISHVLAMGAVAAKKANVDTAEGVRLVTEAVRTGNIEALDSLNIINKGGTAFQAYEAAIRKAAGTMGPAALALKRKAEAMKLLEAETRAYMFGTADLKDQIVLLSNYTRRATARFGEFLGKALAPVMNTMASAAEKAAEFFKTIKENKTLLELTKRVITASAAVGTLLVTLASLKLVFLGLTLTTGGLPGLIGALAAGSVMFLGFEKTLSKVTSGLKTLGKIFTGVWQIVSNFDMSTGLSKMDKDVAEFLVKLGLMTKRTDASGRDIYDGLVVNIGRGMIVVKEFAKGMKDGVVEAFNSIKSIITTVTGYFRDLLNIDSGPWASSWITGAKEWGQVVGKWVLPVIGGLLAIKGIKSVFGAVTGKGKTRSGSPTDPLFVVMMNRLGGALTKIPGIAGLGGAISRLTQTIALKIPFLAQILTNPRGKAHGIGYVLGSMTSKLGSAMKTAFTWGAGVLLKTFTGLGSIIVTAIKAAIPFIGPALALAGAAVVGTYIGKKIEPIVTETLDKHTTATNEEGYTGNALERSMFWLDKKTGWLGGYADKFTNAEKQIAEADKRRQKKKEDLKLMSDLGIGKSLEEMYTTKQETETAKPKVSTVTNPRVFSDEMSRVDELSSEMAGLKGAEQDLTRKRIEEALAANSEGGSSITDVEMEKVRNLIRAINESDMTKYAKATADALTTPTSNIQSRRNN